MSRAQLTSTVEQNTGGAVAPFVAGKNKIINGDFGIWQRGTSFSNSTDNTYTADRFTYYSNGSNTRTISQQTFTPGTAPVAGYEGTYFFRYNQTTAGSGAGYNGIYHRVEDVRTFAGQAVTLSVWAKADSARTLSFAINRNYGSGGSSTEYSVVTDSNMSVTTGWNRFTYSFTMPSVSGKTIGASSFVEIGIKFPLNVTQTLDIWGVQLEAGSVATPFTTATGTLQGELAACQRYYFRKKTGVSNSGNLWECDAIGNGYHLTGSDFRIFPSLPAQMRTVPSISFSGALKAGNIGGQTIISTITSFTQTSVPNTLQLVCGLSGTFAGTAGSAGSVGNTSTTVDAYVEYNSEL